MTLNHETTKPGRKTVAQKIGLCLTPEQRAKGCLLLRIKSPELNARFTRKLYSGFIGADATPFAKAVLAVPGLGYRLNRVDVGTSRLVHSVLKYWSKKAYELVLRQRQQVEPISETDKDQWIDQEILKPTLAEFLNQCKADLERYQLISTLRILNKPAMVLLGFLLARYYVYYVQDPPLSCDCFSCCHPNG